MAMDYLTVMNILHVKLIQLTSLSVDLAISMILGFLQSSLQIRTKQPCAFPIFNKQESAASR